MNASTAIICVILAFLVFLAVRRIVKKGSCGCESKPGSCGGNCCHCSSAVKEQVHKHP